MISFLHPGFVYAAAAGSAIVIALHFLVAEQPRAGMLPTARFFPDVDVRSTTLAVRLSDILLMILRVATLMLIGAAFAQPKVKPSRSAILRIVAVDGSGSVASHAEAADSAAKFASNAAAVIVFDSTARELSTKNADATLRALSSYSSSRKAGSLSSALIVALRAASRLRDHADSLELVIVSPFLAEESDSATLAIRRLWPGRIELVRVGGRAASSPAAARTEWPDSAGSVLWSAKEKPDTIGGLAFGGQMIVYPFIRKWKLASHDGSVRVTGRWIDGEPAIVERTTASGCTRSIAVSLPSAGDAILRTSFVRFFGEVNAHCYQSDFSPPRAQTLAALSGNGGLAPTARFSPEAARMTPLVPWLLGAALLFAIIEIPIRRRSARHSRREVDSAVNASLHSEREGKVA